jgi:hypothetical protein
MEQRERHTGIDALLFDERKPILLRRAATRHLD